MRVFPAVDQELAHWSNCAEKIPDPELRCQALASICSKKFHAQGGSIYALYPCVSDPKVIINFIVAFQTISDYLDNLCDRAGVEDETAFRQLHLAMSDAVEPEAGLNDYYRYYPYKNDLGYLTGLVTECRNQILKLPAFPVVINSLKHQIHLYTNLQSLKHLEKSIRKSKLSSWANFYQNLYPNLLWWEFAAATGSTLGIFLLTAAASEASLTVADVAKIDQAYFPYINGLHILLDYYIDSQEDQRMGDLNFVDYYNNRRQCQDRLQFFIDKSLKNCAFLRYSKFHQTIIRGLLSMYLSDAKALTALNRPTTTTLLKKSGAATNLYYRSCRLLRALRVI
jgi:tetraprenyl-beta-curcumene synthase